MEKLEKVEFAIELLREMHQQSIERISHNDESYEDSNSYTTYTRGYRDALVHAINLLETALKDEKDN